MIATEGDAGACPGHGSMIILLPDACSVNRKGSCIEDNSSAFVE